MALKSMTGFARSEGHFQTTSWHWEVRTLNGRGLDIRLRLPQGYEALDQRVRELCTKTLARGNCTINLNIKQDVSTNEVRLNEQALSQVISAMQEVNKHLDVERPSVDGILALRGVLEISESTQENTERENLFAAILEDFSTVLQSLSKMRAEEGERLSQAITEQIQTIENLVQSAEQAASRKPDFIKSRLQEQINRILELDTASSFSEDRLYQEALLLAAKADVEEEIDRLKSHITAVKELVQSEKPTGRRLDFLTQEFNREANTICSKANDNEISHIGLELKATIDQMREQVQNIE